jgi:hypothetical protein
MSRKRTVAAGVLGAVVAGLVGVQFQAAAGYREALACEAGESARLDAVRRSETDQSEYQQRLVTELVLGRLSLADAAGCLLEANRTRPGWLDTLEAIFPDDPGPQARAARTLVTWSELRTRDDPSHRAEVLGRLSTELGQMTGRPG